jgi:hypothetical protein
LNIEASPKKACCFPNTFARDVKLFLCGKGPPYGKGLIALLKGLSHQIRNA